MFTTCVFARTTITFFFGKSGEISDRIYGNKRIYALCQKRFILSPTNLNIVRIYDGELEKVSLPSYNNICYKPSRIIFQKESFCVIQEDPKILFIS